MKIYFEVDENGYLDGWSSSSFSENEISLKVDDNHEVLTNPYIFKYEDGALIKDENKQNELIVQHEKEQNNPNEVEALALAVMELGYIIMNGGE